MTAPGAAPMCLRRRVIAVATTALVAVACAHSLRLRDAASGPPLRISEHPLASFPPGPPRSLGGALWWDWSLAGWYVVSPDGRRIAWLRRDGSQSFPVVDGSDLPPRGWIRPASLAFSADGGSFAYTAVVADGFAVVVDGAEGPHYDVCRSPVFSPSGRRVVYAARSGRRAFCVLDGRELATFDEIVLGPRFSPDGQHVVYLARTGAEYETVCDDTATAHLAGEVPAFATSADGAHSACVVGSRKVPRHWAIGAAGSSVAVDGVVGPEYEAVADPAMSADGSRHAYIAWTGASARVVIDGRPEGDYDDVRRGSVAFSPDGSHVAYVASRGARWSVVVDGREERHARVIGVPVFSARGGHLAYAAVDDGESFLVLDGRRGRTVHLNTTTLFDQHADWGPMRPSFSADGEHVTYWADGAGVRAESGEVSWFVNDGAVVVIDGEFGVVTGHPRTAPAFGADGGVGLVTETAGFSPRLIAVVASVQPVAPEASDAH